MAARLAEPVLGPRSIDLIPRELANDSKSGLSGRSPSPDFFALPLAAGAMRTYIEHVCVAPSVRLLLDSVKDRTVRRPTGWLLLTSPRARARGPGCRNATNRNKSQQNTTLHDASGQCR